MVTFSGASEEVVLMFLAFPTVTEVELALLSFSTGCALPCIKWLLNTEATIAQVKMLCMGFILAGKNFALKNEV